MSQFDSILSSLQKEDYSAKSQLLQYLLHILKTMQTSKKPLTEEDKTALLTYACSEADAFLTAIAQATSYKEKDQIFECEDLLLGLIMQVCPSAEALPPQQLTRIRALTETVAKERVLENTLDELFRQESIEDAAVAQLLQLAGQVQDEYQKGKLYAGLLHYQKELSRLSAAARTQLAAYLAAELQRYLGQSTHTEEVVSNLELIADLCRHFADDALASLLYDLLALGHNNINFYAAGSLLALGKALPVTVVAGLAADLQYANLTYQLLEGSGQQGLFPKEYTAPEYLAKSDLVRWLTYPTELGKAPDAIEYLGKVTYLFKKEVYFVFKYRSDSDTLDDDSKNKWLIGWSSADGGTFSNFDKYELFEKSTLDATLKNIKKKLLG